MKKLVVFIMVLILIFSVCACNKAQLPANDNQQSSSDENQQSSNDNIFSDVKYKLTVIDYWGYLIKPLNEYYKEGEEVEVTLAFLSGPSIGIELNGEYIGEIRTRGMTVFILLSPLQCLQRIVFFILLKTEI